MRPPVSSRPPPRPCGRGGDGRDWEFATLSSPIHWHLAPSSGRRLCWLPVPRRCIVPHGPADRVRPYSGAGRPDVLPSGVGLLSEASQPGQLARPSTGCLLTGPGRAATTHSRPVSAGIGWCHRAGGTDGFPALRVLPLYSQVAFLSHAGDAVFGTPRVRILLPWPPHPASRQALDSRTHSAAGSFPLRFPVAKPGPLDGLSMVRYRQEQPPALAHSSNCRPGADCVRLRRWKPHPQDVTRLAAGLGCRPHFWFVLPTTAARRLAPCSHFRQGATLARGAGDICLRRHPPIAGWFPKGPGTPVPPDHFPGLAPGLISWWLPVPRTVLSATHFLSKIYKHYARNPPGVQIKFCPSD